MKARYLTFFSYIGTTFRYVCPSDKLKRKYLIEIFYCKTCVHISASDLLSFEDLALHRRSEKLWMRTGRNYTDPESVQGLMELALLKLRSLSYPNVTLSSRTDGGVHALNASAHFDLQKFGQGIYEPNNVAYQMNKIFFKNNTPIFIKKCLRVNDTFNSRFKAIGRTYLYRLAVMKQNVVLPENVSIGSVIPVEEWKRCQFTRLNDFDIEKFKEGSKYLVGYHDFTTFKKSDKLRAYKHNRREIYSINVQPGKPVVTSYTSQQENLFDYWDIEIKGRAFVHNQIRRMVGVLNSVAVGKIHPTEIKVMLQVPSKLSWVNFVQCVPPDGLYLCDVEYKPEDLVYNADSTDCVSETDNQEDTDSDCD